MMQDICPYCETITNLEFIQKQTSIPVRGESINVEDRFFRCLECGGEFDDPKSPYDVLELAYKKYHHGKTTALCSIGKCQD